MKNKTSEKSVKCVIFDLDGTLVDTIDDLGLACDQLLMKKGITPQWTKDDYKGFVGNGARLLVQRAFGGTLSEAELDVLYALFKEIYGKIKLDHAYAYEGMTEVVNTLKKKGVKLAVCTNKPDAAAKGMVEHFFGSRTFDMVLGAVDGVPKKPDPAMANKIAEALGVNANECVWIGDSAVDIESADNFGCGCIAVSWGFRSKESLFERKPDHLVDAPKDILKILVF
ncbi:MAG: HAD-IA family hydrolase [Eubacterium sp.]|nr:HAD-IA family hydrolase [Eubacterium sp.]